ncbi:hypothetical protein, partial [Mesorhizobium sp. M7A.F.Ca.CA.004.04.1.1]|uniref:hypothetical protein n=1 Tax=Mesorhizobium sp. M7A.F.Ca.CA.004.04.1.1 TaxID=2496733 RepID=UPI0019D28A66
PPPVKTPLFSASPATADAKSKACYNPRIGVVSEARLCFCAAISRFGGSGETTVQIWCGLLG